MGSGESSLARRVGWTAAGTAFTAGLATLLVLIALVDHLERAEARADATALAEAVAREVSHSPSMSPSELEAEVAEFTHGDLAIAVFSRRGELLAGAAALSLPDEPPCDFGGDADERWLRCAAGVGDGRRIVVGEPERLTLAHRTPLALGGALALVAVLLMAIVAGVLVGRWALRPLADLESAVARVDAVHPGARSPQVPTGLREVDRIGAALDALLAGLDAELQRSRRFSANAAHELRTPLAKLRAELELFVEAPEDVATLTSSIRRIDELAQLVDRLLILASPGDALLSPTLTSVAVLVEDSLDDLAPAEAARVQVELAADGLVRGDATVLRSVVTNAVKNALSYSDGGVTVRVAREGDDVVLRVDDQGPGLGAEGRARAFEPFYRGTAAKQGSGHGIGLALIAHVVGAHGGRVRFLPEEPGAKLEVRLPAHGSRGLPQRSKTSCSSQGFRK